MSLHCKLAKAPFDAKFLIFKLNRNSLIFNGKFDAIHKINWAVKIYAQETFSIYLGQLCHSLSFSTKKQLHRSWSLRALCWWGFDPVSNNFGCAALHWINDCLSRRVYSGLGRAQNAQQSELLGLCNLVHIFKEKNHSRLSKCLVLIGCLPIVLALSPNDFFFF